MSKTKIITGAIAALVIVIACGIFVYIHYGPDPSAQYYSKILNRLGTPTGYTIDPTRTELRNSGLGGTAYARRAFTGNPATAMTATNLIADLKSIGFKNASLGNPSLLGEGEVSTSSSNTYTSQLYATCKNVAIGIYLNQHNDDPIDIEVYSAGYKGSPSCPWLL